jgi:hypothetical protein
MRFMKYIIVAVASVFALSACSSSSDSSDQAQKQEQLTQQQNYDQGVKDQPAHKMGYSPTRDTINAWIDVWSKPGQLAYVYLSNASGDITDYYVFKHPPVSYCTSLTPTYHVLRYDGGTDGATNPLLAPAPAMDKVYYSGGECGRMYGFDAVSGAYQEFTVGLGINMHMTTQPIPPQQLQDATPWGKAAQSQ